MDRLAQLRERQDEYTHELTVKQAVLQVKKNDLDSARSALAACISNRDRIKAEEQEIIDNCGQLDSDIDNLKNNINELTNVIASLRKELSGIFVFSFGRKKDLKRQIEAKEGELNQEKNRLNKMLSDRFRIEKERKTGLLESMESRVVEQELLIVLLEKEVASIEDEIEMIHDTIYEIGLTIHKQIEQSKKVEEDCIVKEVKKSEQEHFVGLKERETESVAPIDEEEEIKVETLSFYKALLLLRSDYECWNFLVELIGHKEYEKYEQRAQIAKLLDCNAIYKEVHQKTGASTATISRVNAMITNDDEFHRVISENRNKRDKSIIC